jgi:hypothetical protein
MAEGAHSDRCTVHIAAVRTSKRAICIRSAPASPRRAESIISPAAFSSRVSRAASNGTLPRELRPAATVNVPPPADLTSARMAPVASTIC